MPSVIVVGGGIIGCSTAYYLARQGVDVAVIERGSVAGEASSAAAGILASLSDHGEHPAFFDDLCDRSVRLYDEWLPALSETGIDIRHRRIGILDLALTESEVRDLTRLFERRRSLKPLRWLEPDEARKLEPQINPRTAAAMLTPEVQYLDPLRLTQAIAAAAEREGASVHDQEPLVRFLRHGDRLRGIKTPQATYEADAIVLAGGPWTMALAQRLGNRVPVRPVRGQMLSLEEPSAELQHIVWGFAAFVMPREDGQTYVGATVEEAGYRKQTTAAGLSGLRAGAAALVPALAGARQRRAWAGLRPAMPDGLPVMGRLPGWRNAWVSSGHFRNGILLAPISGQLLADAIVTGKGDALPQGLSPGRFAN
jgi:glycine oxidase